MKHYDAIRFLVKITNQVCDSLIYAVNKNKGIRRNIVERLVEVIYIYINIYAYVSLFIMTWTKNKLY